MNENEQQERLYSYTFGEDTVNLPVPPEQYDQLPRQQQAALYDRAMAEQFEWTDDTIVSHPDWVWAARTLYPHINPETTGGFQARYDTLVTNDPWRGGVSPAEASAARYRMSRPSVDQMSDEELGEWLFDHIGELNGNLSGLVTSATDASDDPEIARALNIGLMRYSNKNVSLRGAGNVVEGVLQDPATYLGISSVARGGAMAFGGKQAVRGEIIRRLGRIAYSAGAIGAVEGGAYAAADNAARQSIDNTATGDDEYDLSSIGVSAGLGALIGGTFGFVLGDAIGLDRLGRQNLQRASEAAQEAAENRLDDVVADAIPNPSTPSQATPEAVPVFPRAEGLDAYNDAIPQPSTPEYTLSTGPTLPGALDADTAAQRIRDLESAATPENVTGFDLENAYKGRRLATQLRRWLTSDNPQERQIARQAIFTGRESGSDAVRAQALQTLADDSARRTDEIAYRIDLEAASETPDTPLLNALYEQFAEEQRRFAEFEGLSKTFNSELGTNLRAIQGQTYDELRQIEILNVEQWVRRRTEADRLRVMENGAVGRTETPTERAGWWTNTQRTLIELQRNHLLSAPKTFIANVAGPILNTAAEWVEELVGSVGTRYADDVGEIAVERLNGFTRMIGQSFELGWQSVKDRRISTGIDFIDGEDGVIRAISAESYGMTEGTLGAATVNFLGKGVRLVDGIQLFSDSFVTSRLAIAETFAQARIAGRREGLSGKALDDFVRRRLARTFDADGLIHDRDLLQEVERIVARQRVQRGEAATITDHLIRGGEAMYRVAPITRILIPFWRTPLRLLQQGVRRMPILQQFSKSFRRDLSGQNGYRAFVRARGQFAMAQGFAGLIVLGTINGMVKGEPHAFRDFRIAAEGDDLNRRDSFGEFVYSNLDPVAMPARLISRITEEMVYAAHLNDEEKFKDLEDRFSAVFTGILQVVSAGTVEQTMLQGFEDTIQAFQIATDPDNPDTGGAVGRWFAQRATTFYPNLLKKVEVFINTESEQGTDFTTSLIASTGLRDAIEAMTGLDLPRVTTRLNMLGEPVEQDAVLSMFGIVANENSDPVREELQRLMETSGTYIGNMKFRRAEANDMDLRYELTDDGETTIFDAWQRNLNYGPEGEPSYLRQELEALFESQAYKEGTVGRRGREGRQLNMVRQVMQRHRELAWERTLTENPEFWRSYEESAFDERLRAFQ